LDAGELEEGMGQPKIDISTIKLPANVDPSPTSPSRTKTPSTDKDQQEAKSPEGISPAKELREPATEHLYMVRSLGNTLSRGDQQIPEPVDKVVDIQEIDYDMKRKVVMRRIVKKRKLTLECTLLITIVETLFDTKNAKMTELITIGMTITNATLDKEKRDEREVAPMKKELDHLLHQVDYYQNSTHTVILLKCEF
jgi:hypothetical protein